MRRLLAFAFLSITVIYSSVLIGDEARTEKSDAEVKVVLASEIEWQQLNPARGDKSPKAGTIWGDRGGLGPTGFLVKFVDGFSSPPHIHNVSYRGVVISGLVHNDDPSAKEMWMPKGSFWTQPKRLNHITAAKGTTIAYIEIEQGPYLVLPSQLAVSGDEWPVNVHKSNIVWLGASNTHWVKQAKEASSSTTEPKISFLWGTPQDTSLNGTLIKLPVGFTGKLKSHSSSLRAVVIQGTVKYKTPSEIKVLEPGGYFHSKGECEHDISSSTEEESLIYVRTRGTYEVVMEKSE